MDIKASKENNKEHVWKMYVRNWRMPFHFFLHSKVLSLTLRESEKYVKTRNTETAVAVATSTKQHNRKEQQQNEKCKNKHLMLKSKKFLSKNLKAGFRSFRILLLPSAEMCPYSSVPELLCSSDPS